MTPNVILRVENLHKSYKDTIAVKNLTLDVYQGEILGLLGPNGAGKTTTISMICGLIKPDKGKLFIEGQAVHPHSQNLRNRIGMCPQDIVLWDKLTCLEQLTFMGKMYNIPPLTAQTRAEELLDVMGLKDKRRKLANTLSGGMRRRLNLAMALIHQPDILILDEPEAGLDPQSRILVREYIRDWASDHQRTVILTTHNMDEADRMSNRVAILDHGELLVVDTNETLKNRIGEGDVLEITIKGVLNGDKALQIMSPIAHHVSRVENTLVLREKNIVQKISITTEKLESAGFTIQEIRLRKNTLEDVFIELTGRRLRE